MKCQDVSRLLDSSLPGSLDRARHAAIEAHLATCPACREDWANWRDIAALAVPAMPGTLRTRIAAVLPAQRRRPARPSLRPIVVTGLLLAGAALAATLAWRFAERGADPANATRVVAATPRTQVAGNQPAAPATSTTAQADSDRAPRPQPAGAAALADSLLVLVLPLVDESTDPPGKSAVRDFHAALLDGLRELSVLRVIEAAAGVAEIPADYRLTVKGEGSGAAGSLTANLKIEKPGSGPVPTATHLQASVTGSIGADCVRNPGPAADPAARCADPVELARFMIGQLRTMVFPPDPLLRQQLQDSLVNAALDAGARLEAMEEIVQQASSGGFLSGEPGASPLKDAEVMRSAIDIGLSAKDPAHRAYVWRRLRGVRDAALASPLVAALEQDPDPSVRVAAAVTLDADYLDRPEVRAAFERAARSDPRALVRALAQRALGAGDAGWREHIATALRDATLPDEERIEALFHGMGLPMTTPFGSWGSGSNLALQHLDDAAMDALAEVLPRAAAASAVIQRASATLLGALEGRDSPAIRALREALGKPAAAVTSGSAPPAR